MKLTAVVVALFLITLPATASAQDELPVCGPDRTLVMSAGGPLCVGDIYLDGSWNDDPRDCVYGYYQGSCAPAPQVPEPLPVEAYLFQMDNPSPEYVAGVVAKRDVLIGKVSRFQAGLARLLG